MAYRRRSRSRGRRRGKRGRRGYVRSYHVSRGGVRL